MRKIDVFKKFKILINLLYLVQSQATSCNVLKVMKKEIFGRDQDLDTTKWPEHMKKGPSYFFYFSVQNWINHNQALTLFGQALKTRKKFFSFDKRLRICESSGCPDVWEA